MDSGGWHCLQSVPNAYYLPAYGHHEDDSSSVSHGDDFLAEGSGRTLSELDRLLNEQFEVTAGNMIGPGEARANQVSQEDHLHRRYGGPGFFWTADPKHVDFLVQWTKKRGGKPAVTPGTKATGMGARDSLELLSRSRAREVAGAGGTALYLSSDRPDTMFASKTAMQHVSKPNVLMNARLQRLGLLSEPNLRHYPRGHHLAVLAKDNTTPLQVCLRSIVASQVHKWRCSQVWFAHVGLLLSHTGHDRTKFCRVGVLCDR